MFIVILGRPVPLAAIAYRLGSGWGMAGARGMVSLVALCVLAAAAAGGEELLSSCVVFIDQIIRSTGAVYGPFDVKNQRCCFK